MPEATAATSLLISTRTPKFAGRPDERGPHPGAFMSRIRWTLSLALSLAISVHAMPAPSSAAPVVRQESGSSSATDWLQVAEKSESITRERPHDGQAWLRWGQALLELD